MTDKVAVFLDYQNVYQGARQAFNTPSAPGHIGNIDPVKLAEYLIRDRPSRELVDVRVYRGIPSNARDPGGYAAARRQGAAWQRDPRLTLFSRPLHYGPGCKYCSRPPVRPREKGIDVALCVDLAVMGVEGQYDTGIVFSTDTDLEPALEYVAGLTNKRGTPRAEVAAWSPRRGTHRRLSVPNRNLYCHWLDYEAYRAVQDTRNYAIPTRPRRRRNR